jgi:hypothetical protein
MSNIERGSGEAVRLSQDKALQEDEDQRCSHQGANPATDPAIRKGYDHSIQKHSPVEDQWG